MQKKAPKTFHRHTDGKGKVAANGNSVASNNYWDFTGSDYSLSKDCTNMNVIRFLYALSYFASRLRRGRLVS